MTSITELLSAWNAGDEDAGERLAQAIHGDLHRMAQARMRQQPAGHTLQPTALVNEAWLKLRRQLDGEVEHSAHLRGLVARAMRSILVDHARTKNRKKRSTSGERLALDEIVAAYEERSADLQALDEALRELDAMDARLARLVDLKFFAAATTSEIASDLGISKRQVAREWTIARAWLHRKLS